jgi:hypothetical protein
MPAKRADAVLGRSQVLELASRTAEPAVTILVPLPQPLTAHPGTELRVRALVERALEITESWWGADAARRIAAQLERSQMELDLRNQRAHGLAFLVTPDDGQLLRLPFPVEEQVVVDRTFATRQLLEGIARNPRYRVLILDGHHAHLHEGQGRHLVEVTAYGFPVHVEPPHEQDTPQRDFPIRDQALEEEHRAVYRVVDRALDAASRAEQLPLVIAGAERELAFFDEVTAHGELVSGRLAGNYARTDPDRLADAVRPVLDAHFASEQAGVVECLREAHGREHAVFGLHAVKEAADEGRGHLLVVEEGFTFPGHWVDGLAPGAGPDEQLDFDDLVDDVIETVLLGGGGVEFVDDGALSDVGSIGLLLRY